MIPLDVLRPIPLFKGLDELSLQKIAGAMIAKSVQKMDRVVQQGDTSTDLIFLLRGQLQVVDTSAEGREIGIAVVREGDFLGELSVIDGKPRSASVIALTPSVIAVLPRAVAEEFFFRHPVGSERIIHHLAGKLRGTSARHTQVVSGKAHERVLSILTSLGEPQPDGSVKVAQLPTQNQMAIMANLARETVARTLSELKRNGVLANTPQGPRQVVIRLGRSQVKASIGRAVGQIKPTEPSKS